MASEVSATWASLRASFSLPPPRPTAASRGRSCGDSCRQCHVRIDPTMGSGSSGSIPHPLTVNHHDYVAFHSHGATPIAGWFTMGNPWESHLEMDDQGYPHVKAPFQWASTLFSPRRWNCSASGRGRRDALRRWETSITLRVWSSYLFNWGFFWARDFATLFGAQNQVLVFPGCKGYQADLEPKCHRHLNLEPDWALKTAAL